MDNLPHHNGPQPTTPSQVTANGTKAAVLAHIDRLNEIGSREREVCKVFLDTNTNKELANKLFITEKTVKFHFTNIFRKLGVVNRLELFKHLIDWQ